MSLNRNSPIDYLKHSKENTGRQGCSLSIVTGCKHHESDICNIPCYARRMVEAGGGGRACTTPAFALKRNAYTRPAWVNRRSDFRCYVGVL